MTVGELGRIIFGLIVVFIGCLVPAGIELYLRWLSGVWTISNNTPAIGVIFTAIGLTLLCLLSGIRVLAGKHW
jgi:hypothetical protein